MRKWGPAVLIMVALGAMLLWAQCADDPGGFEAASAEELRTTAEQILPAVDRGWRQEEFPKLDVATLDVDLRALTDRVYESEFVVSQEQLNRLVAAIEGAQEVPLDSSNGLADWTTVVLTASRSALVLGDQALSTNLFVKCMQQTIHALSSAVTVDEWQAAQIARLRFLDSTDLLMNDAYTVLHVFVDTYEQVTHRGTLGHAVQTRFLSSGVDKIAAASQSGDVSGLIAEELMPESEGQESELIGALLRGHTRMFDPSLTARAGAESVKALRESLASPWPSARAVLDDVSKAQLLWSEFLTVLDMDDERATATITSLREKARSIENPVGLALLHNERTSWSGLVQSAFVADAREAAFLLKMLRAEGDASEVIDPFSGESLRSSNGRAVFSSDGKNERYPFVAAFLTGG